MRTLYHKFAPHVRQKEANLRKIRIRRHILMPPTLVGRVIPNAPSQRTRTRRFGDKPPIKGNAKPGQARTLRPAFAISRARPNTSECVSPQRARQIIVSIHHPRNANDGREGSSVRPSRAGEPKANTPIRLVARKTSTMWREALFDIVVPTSASKDS